MRLFRTRTVALAVALAAATGLAAPTRAVAASALPASALTADPMHDNASRYDARGDLTGFTMSDNGSQVRLTVTTRVFDDPNGGNWRAFPAKEGMHHEPTGLLFGLDTNRDSNLEDIAIMTNDGTRAVGYVVSYATGDWVCNATAAADAALSMYRLIVGTSCLGSPATIGGLAYIDYFTSAGESEDYTYSIGPIAPTSNSMRPDGYWMVGATGAVYPFGTVPDYGFYTASGVVKIASTPTARGYWVLNRAGHVYAYGDARYLGNATLAAGEAATTMSHTPSGKGYWIFTNKGRALRFGDAGFYGDMSHVVLNGPVVDSVATPTGHGYYMVASDGGVFAFGDARFYGSMGGHRLNKPVMGLVPTADNKGYWLVASDGGIFAFGSAPFRGSMGSIHLNRPVVGMVRNGAGYLMVAADGGIFNFSDRPFYGSLGSLPPNVPIVSVTSST